MQRIFYLTVLLSLFCVNAYAGALVFATDGQFIPMISLQAAAANPTTANKALYITSTQTLTGNLTLTNIELVMMKGGTINYGSYSITCTLPSGVVVYNAANPLRSAPDTSNILGAAIAANLASVVALQTGQSSSLIGYDTQAHLFADLAHAAGSVGYVNSDSSPANDGYYLKSGSSGSGSWTQSSNSSLATLATTATATAATVAQLGVTTQLFNPAAQVSPNIVIGYALNNGSPTYSDPLTFVSSMIPVSPSTQYTVSPVWGANSAGYRGASYTSAGVYISNIDTTTFTTPSNAAFVSFSIVTASSWLTAMMVPGPILPGVFIPYDSGVVLSNVAILPSQISNLTIVSSQVTDLTNNVNGLIQSYVGSPTQLFNPAAQVAPNITNNYSLHNGVANYPTSLFFVSAPIPILPNIQYTASPALFGGTSGYQGAAYTSAGVYISNIDTTTFTTPPLTAYVMFSVLKTNPWTTAMIVPGAILSSSYLAYGWNGPPAATQWTGKKIAWYGTSIPAGYPNQSNQAVYSYANRAAAAVGATCENYCVPNGVLRSATYTGGSMGARDTLSFSNLGSAINYQVSMLNLIGTSNQPDLYVFDYGLNDISADVTDFSMFDPNNPYSTLGTNIPISSRDVDTFIGSFNHMVDLLLAAEPRARVAIITHFSKDDFGGVDGATPLVNIQQALAEYWGFPVLKVYEKTGWRIQGANTLATYMTDSTHPATDVTGQSVALLTTIMISFLMGIN